MNDIFICSHCGNIILADDGLKDAIRKGNINCQCSNVLSIYNIFPDNAGAFDWINTLNRIFDNCKDSDKENQEFITSILTRSNISIDKTELDGYINIFEQIRENTPFKKSFDKFEEKLERKNVDPELIITLASAIMVSNFNRYRNVFIIVLASLIEILFNDFFNNLLKYKIGEGSTIFLKEYENAGIQQCLNIVSSFMCNDINNEMDQISNNFSDKWRELRILRNNIIHSNSQYISKVKLNKFYKLIDKSLIVFSNLSSKIIKKEL